MSNQKKLSNEQIKSRIQYSIFLGVAIGVVVFFIF